VQYNITANMTRGMMAKNLTKQREFVVELEADVAAHQREEKAKPFLFKVSPDSLQNVKESSKKKIPESVACTAQAGTAQLLRPQRQEAASCGTSVRSLLVRFCFSV
jgi:hypothetical protein